MLKQKFLIQNSDNYLKVNLDNQRVNTKFESTDYSASQDNYVSPILDLEKEAFTPFRDFKLSFEFWGLFEVNDPLISASFYRYGTEMKYIDFTNITKNYFKNSFFLLEFFNTNDDDSNTLITSTTLSVYPNPSSKKGAAITTVNGVNEINSVYNISEPLNEGYLLYFFREFNKNNISQFTSNGVEYAEVFMKASFMNAKTGKVHRFINNPGTTAISVNDYKKEMMFFPMRLFRDLTFAFYANDKIQLIQEVVLREKVLI